VAVGEEEGLSCEHAEQILEDEAVERRELDISLEFFEEVSIILHPVG
jgi:hypothetical protein